MSKCQVTPFPGNWEARCLEAGHVSALDHGVCEHAVMLQIPEHGPWQLQELIDEWSGQAHLHALRSAFQLLALRSNRFRHHSGAVCKVNSHDESPNDRNADL